MGRGAEVDVDTTVRLDLVRRREADLEVGIAVAAVVLDGDVEVADDGADLVARGVHVLGVQDDVGRALEASDAVADDDGGVHTGIVFTAKLEPAEYWA